MLPQQNQPAAHAGEDQSSPDVFAPRMAYLANALAGVLAAAKTLAIAYPRDGRIDPAVVLDPDHRSAVVELHSAIDHADALGLSLAGALDLAASGQASTQLWYSQRDRFSASTMPALIAANSFLQAGDIVYQAQAVLRHKLTESDIKSARPVVIGGAQ